MGSFTGCFTLFHALHIHQLAQIAQLFLDTLGFFVSFVVAAPNAAHTQVRKGILQQCTGGFRNQSQKTGDGSLS